MDREMRFCETRDGVRVAFTPPVGDGDGRPLLAVSGWACNVEFELRHPKGEQFYDALARGRPIAWVIPRGVGSSQREIPELSIEALVSDVEAVAERLGWQSFDLWAEGTGTLAITAFAERYPEKVSRLVLWSASANWAFSKPGWIVSLRGLMQSKWWLARRMLGNICFPSGPIELYEWFVEIVGESISPEMAVRYLDFQASTDITALLRRVQAPVMLLHRRGDHVTPIAAGRAIAALLPNARFVALDGDIAFPYFGDTSYIDAVRQFLDEEGASGLVTRPEGMTGREGEVLRLVAAGRSNRQIAEELCISVNTADRHVSNILTKTGASNRAEAASFAVRHRLAE